MKGLWGVCLLTVTWSALAGCDRSPAAAPSSSVGAPTDGATESAPHAPAQKRTEPLHPTPASECESLTAELQRVRDEKARARLERLPSLDEAARRYAERVVRGEDNLAVFANDVHSALGPHAAASFDVIRAMKEASELRQVGMPETRIVGIGCARSGDGAAWVGVVVYGQRDAWPFSREERARLRQGASVYVEAFRRRYRRDTAWSRRYDDPKTKDAAVAEVVAEAAAAAQLSAAEFERRLRLAPLIHDEMIRQVLVNQFEAEGEVQRKLGHKSPSELPPSRKHAQDL